MKKVHKILTPTFENMENEKIDTYDIIVVVKEKFGVQITVYSCPVMAKGRHLYNQKPVLDFN